MVATHIEKILVEDISKILSPEIMNPKFLSLLHFSLS